jgi:hypothetical protein
MFNIHFPFTLVDLLLGVAPLLSTVKLTYNKRLKRITFSFSKLDADRSQNAPENVLQRADQKLAQEFRAGRLTAYTLDGSKIAPTWSATRQDLNLTPDHEVHITVGSGYLSPQSLLSLVKSINLFLVEFWAILCLLPCLLVFNIIAGHPWIPSPMVIVLGIKIPQIIGLIGSWNLRSCQLPYATKLLFWMIGVLRVSVPVGFTYFQYAPIEPAMLWKHLLAIEAASWFLSSRAMRGLSYHFRVPPSPRLFSMLEKTQIVSLLTFSYLAFESWLSVIPEFLIINLTGGALVFWLWGFFTYGYITAKLREHLRYGIPEGQ